jgi:uncharacterized protein YeaO (DUF488 family)
LDEVKSFYATWDVEEKLMKTGFFNLLRKNKIPGAVSIAVGKPRYVKVEHQARQFAPTWSLLKKFRADRVSEAEYVAEFNAQLAGLDASKAMVAITEKVDDPVIMCHCGVQDFCHRHLVAEWLENELGIDIEEYGIGKVVRKDGRID